MQTHDDRNVEARMRNRMLFLGGALVLALSTAAAAQTEEDVTKMPGYVDFEAMKIFAPEDAQVEIIIEPNLLRMLAKGMCKSDPDLCAMLMKLKQIRVQTFTMGNAKAATVEKKVSDLAQKIEGQGWQAMVRMRNRKENEQTYVYIKTRGDIIVGLAVMNIDPTDDAAFVNIVGEIDPEKVGELGAKFNIDNMDSLETEIKKHHQDRKRKM